MNMFEEAKSLDIMMKMRSLSQNETAKMLNVSQSYISNKLRLLKINEKMREDIISAGLTERHARALLRLDEEERNKALEIIIQRGFSVSESEALIDLMRNKSMPKRISRAEKISAADTFVTEVKESLSNLSAIGINSTHKISHFGSKTIITICFENG